MKEAFNMNNVDLSKICKDLLFLGSENRRIERKDDDISKNVNPLICAECGGLCCKSCGCHFSPDDFKDISFNSLKKEMEKGYISIDYVDRELIYSDIGIYILRIRNIGAPIVDTCFGKRTPCILLTEKGCKLDYEHRPTGGKLLIPGTISTSNHEVNCNSTYSIKNCCYEWLPYQKLLQQLVEYFVKKEFPCSL